MSIRRPWNYMTLPGSLRAADTHRSAHTPSGPVLTRTRQVDADAVFFTGGKRPARSPLHPSPDPRFYKGGHTRTVKGCNGAFGEISERTYEPFAKLWGFNMSGTTSCQERCHLSQTPYTDPWEVALPGIESFS
ncbi:hypothetical protein Bbelb_211240 [Branchiostoma belcheri]|nr:hypothetical protein Bbelb_211240 [Branchiostoma belcheri]